MVRGPENWLPGGDLRDILPELNDQVSASVINRATQTGEFIIPESGPGCHSLPNAIERVIFERKQRFQSYPSSLDARRKWNQNNRLRPKRR